MTKNPNSKLSLTYLYNLDKQARKIHLLSNDLVDAVFEIKGDDLIKTPDLLPQVRASNFMAWSAVQEIDKLIQEVKTNGS